MVDIVRCQTSHSGHAVPVADTSRTQVECPWCGPFYPRKSDSLGACPQCKLTPTEVRYAERIIADSTAVYVEEVRAYRAKREMHRKISEAGSPSEALRALGFPDLADKLDQQKGGP